MSLPSPDHILAWHRAQHGRLKGKRLAVLSLLADGLWHGADELSVVGGSRFGARIYELKKFGYVFSDPRPTERPGIWEYRLSGKRAVPPTQSRTEQLVAAVSDTAGLSYEEAIS